MAGAAHDLALRLAQSAEAVCRHYLSAGRREGRYWRVGDARNAPGRSMFVRLRDTERGPAGKWTDAATGEHGDLLDVIRESCGLVDFADVVEEAQAFLGQARLAKPPTASPLPATKIRRSAPEAARRLFEISRPIAGTPAETYLQGRGITALEGLTSLRFHPSCYYRSDKQAQRQTWPAMIGSVTDLAGRQVGAHRTFLDPRGFSETTLGKAPVASPRRAMGQIAGHAVRFGEAAEVMAAGEGIETVLSVRCALPDMSMMAALSATHLTALRFPTALRRLYVVRDNDPAGERATTGLVERARAARIEALVLSPRLGDFNDDLRRLGIEALRATCRMQLIDLDVARFLHPG